jgi:hypothetical protein
MNNQNARPILEVLNKLDVFNPVKIMFNGFELYNDYDSNIEVEPEVFGEILPPMLVIPQRLNDTFNNYDIWISSFDLRIVQHHHCIIYLYGEKVEKSYYNYDYE